VKSGSSRHQAEINVTPLVDVVLVLLIIFMVVTPLIASGIAVDLPRTLHHARKPTMARDIILVDHPRRNGVHRSATGAASGRRRRGDDGRAPQVPDKSVFIKGTSRAPYGVVRQVLAQLHEAKIDDVVLGTEEAM
jgi:biopolymer transport protein ExbD